MSINVRKNKKILYRFMGLITAAIVLAASQFVVQVQRPEPAMARSASQLQDEISQIEEKIKQNEAIVHELEHQAVTLEKKIRQYEIQIANTQNKIEATNLKIQKLSVEIDDAEQELERQKGILAESIRQLYKQGDVTTIEMLASSDSYSDFVNQQEYMARMKIAIQDSANKVEDLKNKLEDDHKQQQSLKADLESQQTELSTQRNGQQQLLEETKGQEAKYQQLVEDLKQQQQAAEAALAAALASGSFKAAPVGPVTAGDVVGAVGNTGLSSGPHLHLEVRLGGNITNPSPHIRHQPVDPVYVTQGFGAANPIYYSGYHPGIDYGPGNGRIYAIDSGYLYRGCSNDILGTSNNAYGYVAIVDHGGGKMSIYAHMSGGPAACNYNTYW